MTKTSMVVKVLSSVLFAVFLVSNVSQAQSEFNELNKYNIWYCNEDQLELEDIMRAYEIIIRPDSYVTGGTDEMIFLNIYNPDDFENPLIYNFGSTFRNQVRAYLSDILDIEDNEIEILNMNLPTWGTHYDEFFFHVHASYNNSDHHHILKLRYEVSDNGADGNPEIVIAELNDLVIPNIDSNSIDAILGMAYNRATPLISSYDISVYNAGSVHFSDPPLLAVFMSVNESRHISFYRIENNTDLTQVLCTAEIDSIRDVDFDNLSMGRFTRPGMGLRQFYILEYSDNGTNVDTITFNIGQNSFTRHEENRLKRVLMHASSDFNIIAFYTSDLGDENSSEEAVLHLEQCSFQAENVENNQDREDVLKECVVQALNIDMSSDATGRPTINMSTRRPPQIFTRWMFNVEDSQEEVYSNISDCELRRKIIESREKEYRILYTDTPVE